MSVIDSLLAILTPYECLGCGAEGSLLCIACIRQLPGVPARCYRCLKPSADGLTCPACAEDGGLEQLRSGAAYSGVAKELVSRLKFSGAKAAAGSMAAHLLPLVMSMDPATAIIPVPTAAGRVRGRGFDQAKLLARALSRASRLTYLDCLARSGHTRQVGASRRERLVQTEGMFRVRSAIKLRPGPVLLVDDVITTGSTLESAAAAMKQAGVRQISAVVFARA